MAETLETRTENNIQPEDISRLKLAGAALGGAVAGGVLGCVGGYVNQFILPSAVISFNDKLGPAIESVRKSENIYWGFGEITMVISGVGAMGYVMYEQISSAIQKASEGNYTHLGVLVAANIASAGLELFRFGYRMGKRRVE